MRGVLTEYATSLPKLQDELDRAIAALDLQRASRVAHTIRGAASTAGAVAVANMATNIETACREGATERLADLRAMLNMSRQLGLFIAILPSQRALHCGP